MFEVCFESKSPMGKLFSATRQPTDTHFYIYFKTLTKGSVVIFVYLTDLVDYKYFAVITEQQLYMFFSDLSVRLYDKCFAPLSVEIKWQLHSTLEVIFLSL